VGSTRQKNGACVLFLFLLLLALSLRLAALDRSLWVDETRTFESTDSWGSVVDRHVRAGRGDVHPPLYFALVRLARFLSEDPSFLRALFLPFGLLSLLFVHRIGRLRGGHAVGLAGLFLAAVSPAAIRYSVELRPYSLLLFFSSIATYAFFRILSGGGTKDRVLFAAATALNLYTHLFAAVLYASQALFLAIPWAGERRSYRRDLAAAAIPLLLFLPWLRAALLIAERRAARGADAGGLAEAAFFVRAFLETLAGFAGGKLLAFSATTALLLAGIVRLRRSHRLAPAIDAATLLLPAALFTASRPDHHPNVRYFLFLYPYWAVLVGAGAVGIGERLARARLRLRPLLIGAAALLPVLLLFLPGEKPDIWIRSDRWEDVRDAIEKQLTPKDAVLSAPESFTVARLLLPIARPPLAEKLRENRSIVPPYGEPFRRADETCERIWAIVVGEGRRSEEIREGLAPAATERRDFRMVECRATLFRIDR
jgi:hypothetical protein